MIVVKADVQGSSEAIKEALLSLGNEEVSCRVIHVGAGAGVVADSVPENEWQECVQKSKVFADAMEMLD